jgi:hypothetical protein
MFFKKQIVSAMAGAAMLALPISSFAANYDYSHNHTRAAVRSQAFVNRGVSTMAPRYANTYNYNHGQWAPSASWASTPNRPWQQYAASNGSVPSNNWSYWHNHPYAWNNGYAPGSSYQPYVAPGYSTPAQCTTSNSLSGQSIRTCYSYGAPNYSGNNLPGLLGLPGYSGYGQPGYSGNGVPVYAGVPGYSGNGLQSYPGDANNLNWLMQKRYDTMRTIAQLRAQGDSKGAARLVPVVTALNNRINSMR